MTRASERGSAAVEFALVLPLLLVVALGLVQVGLFLRDQLVLVEAARAGAREAAVTASDEAVRSAVDRAAATLDGSALGVRVTREGRGNPATVELTYEDSPAISVVRWLFPQNLILRARVSMRQEFG